MAFFDDVKKNLSQAGQKTAQKAKDLSETASLNRAVSDGEKKINSLLLELGTSLYEKNVDSPIAGYEDYFTQISELKADIAEKKERLAELNAASNCPVCGDKLRADASFCSNCGYRIPEKGRVCPNCGRQANSDTIFCPACGTKI